MSLFLFFQYYSHVKEICICVMMSLIKYNQDKGQNNKGNVCIK